MVAERMGQVNKKMRIEEYELFKRFLDLGKESYKETIESYGESMRKYPHLRTMLLGDLKRQALMYRLCFEKERLSLSTEE